MDPINSSNAFDPAIPLHEQIRRNLEDQIRKGIYKAGDKLPSEAELQHTFGVSRTTVQHALEALETSGYIYRAQGRGSFVKEHKIGIAVRSLSGFSKQLQDVGLSVNTKTLFIKSIRCDEITANELNIKVNAPVIYIQRLFLVDSEPLALFDHRLLPVIPIESFKKMGNFISLYEILTKEGYEIDEALERITAKLLTEKEASLLSVEMPYAALLFKRTAMTSKGLHLEYTTYLMRADRYETLIQLRSMTR
jgi:GntR family transcriptional regulator